MRIFDIVFIRFNGLVCTSLEQIQHPIPFNTAHFISEHKNLLHLIAPLCPSSFSFSSSVLQSVYILLGALSVCAPQRYDAAVEMPCILYDEIINSFIFKQPLNSSVADTDICCFKITNASLRRWYSSALLSCALLLWRNHRLVGSGDAHYALAHLQSHDGIH